MNQPERIKLFAFYSDENAVLKDRFLASMKDDWEVHLKHLGRLGGGGGDWGSPGFERLARLKTEFLVDEIIRNEGQVIVWSDTDIQFFKECGSLVSEAMASLDIVFLAEHWPDKEVNLGFMAIRCNTKTQDLFRSVLEMDFEKMKYYDQSAMNLVLNRPGLAVAWDVLPRVFWSASIGGGPPPGIVLHHANGTKPRVWFGRRIGSNELKVRQMEDVLRILSASGFLRTLYDARSQTIYVLYRLLRCWYLGLKRGLGL